MEKQGTVFTDMADRDVLIPDSVGRIVSNGPPGTLILYTLDEDILIARNYKASGAETAFCTKRYCSLPQIGRWYQTRGSRNVEMLIQLYPDVLISCGNIERSTVEFANKEQRYLGIPVLLFSTKFQDLTRTYEKLGELLGKQKKASEINRFINKYLVTVINHSDSIPEKEKPSVYLAIGDNGLTTSSRGSIHAQVLDLAGAKNVAELEHLTGHAEVNIEQVLNWDPDVILACGWGSVSSYELRKNLLGNTLWSGIKAVQNEFIFPVPMKPYCWIDLPPSINQIIGVIWLSSILYPEWFPFDLNDVTREFYDIFYHYNASPDEIEMLLGMED